MRLIDGPLAGAICPIFQTSANLSGAPAPAAFADVEPAILDAVDLAIDGGALTGLPSTVVDLTGIEDGGGWRVLREGGMPAAELERRLGGEAERLRPRGPAGVPPRARPYHLGRPAPLRSRT